MIKTFFTIGFLILAVSAHAAGQDPFEGVLRRYLWALDVIASHQPEKTVEAPSNQPARHRVAKMKKAAARDDLKAENLPTPIHMNFKATTAWAAISADVVDYGTHFTVDVSTDQPANGWQLKKQSTREVLLKGGLNSQFQFSFDCAQPYTRDFGLTVFIGDNSYPSFLQLFQ